jgi:hypothetical protein
MAKEVDNGTAYFLVHDEEYLKEKGNSQFVKWLYSEGFKTHELYSGYWDYVSAIYVNINNKTVAFGRPGIRLFEFIGNHAITVEEFKIIYNIYKKYDGKAPFEF